MRVHQPNERKKEIGPNLTQCITCLRLQMAKVQLLFIYLLWRKGTKYENVTGKFILLSLYKYTKIWAIDMKWKSSICTLIIIIIIIKFFYSLWSIEHPWRASRHCGLQLFPWPRSMIFLRFLSHPLFSYATFSSVYLSFHIPEDSNLMQFFLLLIRIIILEFFLWDRRQRRETLTLVDCVHSSIRSKYLPNTSQER